MYIHILWAGHNNIKVVNTIWKEIRKNKIITAMTENLKRERKPNRQIKHEEKKKLWIGRKETIRKFTGKGDAWSSNTNNRGVVWAFGYFILYVVLPLLNVLRNPSTSRGIGTRTSFDRHGNWDAEHTGGRRNMTPDAVPLASFTRAFDHSSRFI